MLFLHEVHEVIGKREDEFEAAFRDEWLPTLAATDDARLLYFLHHAHGTGVSYNVVTIRRSETGRPGSAWLGASTAATSRSGLSASTSFATT